MMLYADLKMHPVMWLKKIHGGLFSEFALILCIIRRRSAKSVGLRVSCQYLTVISRAPQPISTSMERFGGKKGPLWQVSMVSISSLPGSGVLIVATAHPHFEDNQ